MRPTFEVADIFRQYGAAYRSHHAMALRPEQRRVMRAIELCRTKELGGHVAECLDCGHQQISYNSCRNRHCPKCQSQESARWLAERQAELLPVPYFHVVFTLPDELSPLALQNKRVIYNLLFGSVSTTLRRIAVDAQHLGAEIGFLAVLHTWGQQLQLHPHLHCVVPGGGLSPDGQQWKSCRSGFFLPVRVLARLLRRLFLEGLEEAFAQQRLSFHGRLARLADRAAFAALLAKLKNKEWVVYAKPPFGSPLQVLSYLGRYTHRVAISNHRLLKVEAGRVSFLWKDYRRGHQQRVMTLRAEEFIRRFLLHILPEGFQRLRYYGLLSNRGGTAKLAQARRLLGCAAPPVEVPPPDDEEPAEEMSDKPVARCPACGSQRWRRVEILEPRLYRSYESSMKGEGAAMLDSS